eukprot:8545885-Pyramimonas_sp.AAC.1
MYINVSGLGKQNQLVEREAAVLSKVISNDAKSSATYAAPNAGTEEEPPTVPALRGIKSMRHQQAVIDPGNNDMHLCGPGRVR